MTLPEFNFGILYKPFVKLGRGTYRITNKKLAEYLFNIAYPKIYSDADFSRVKVYISSPFAVNIQRISENIDMEFKFDIENRILRWQFTTDKYWKYKNFINAVPNKSVFLVFVNNQSIVLVGYLNKIRFTY